MFVTYEISPLMEEVSEHRRSLTHFLTGVCAIVGGVFTGELYLSYRAMISLLYSFKRRLPHTCESVFPH